MRRGRGRDGAGPAVLGAAGWLFAELAMVLTVVAIGSEQKPASVADERVPPTTSSSPGSSTTVPAPAVEAGLSLRSVRFTMPVPEDDRAVVATFAVELGRAAPTGTSVGLIILFGTSDSGDPGEGVQVSKRVSALIGPAGFPQLRSTQEVRTYFGGDGPPGSVTVELFLFTGPA